MSEADRSPGIYGDMPRTQFEGIFRNDKGRIMMGEPDYYKQISSMAAKVPDDSVWVVSYPKTGTHWLCTIAQQLIAADGAKVGEQPDRFDPAPPLDVFVRIPVMDLVGIEQKDFFMKKSAQELNVHSTHLPYDEFIHGIRDGEKNAKLIVTYRNPKDVLVSFYHFHVSMMKYAGTWAEFYEAYMNNDVMYSFYLDHLYSWWSHRLDDHVYFVSYERMLKDFEFEAAKLAKFLGKTVSAEQLALIKEKTSISSQKANIKYPHESTFYRKGIVGDWEEHFTVWQSEQFDRHIAEKLAAHDDFNVVFEYD